jgi:hypothetical protein
MSRTVRAGIVVIAILLVLNLVATGFLFFSVSAVEDRVGVVENETQTVTDHLLRVGQLSNGDSANGTASADIRTGYLLAHDSDTREGIMFEYRYQPLPGDSMYVDGSGAVVDPSFQESLQNSREAVKQSEYEPVTYGLAITLDTPEAWDYVRGESAGLAIATQLASMDPRYERNESVVLTGQVEPDGSVVSVNYVEKKGQAAAANGKKVLVAPHSSSGIEVDGIKIVHVQTVSGALDYALDPVDAENTTTKSG